MLDRLYNLYVNVITTIKVGGDGFTCSALAASHHSLACMSRLCSSSAPVVGNAKLQGRQPRCGRASGGICRPHCASASVC